MNNIEVLIKELIDYTEYDYDDSKEIVQLIYTRDPEALQEASISFQWKVYGRLFDSKEKFPTDINIKEIRIPTTEQALNDIYLLGESNYFELTSGKILEWHY